MDRVSFVKVKRWKRSGRGREEGGEQGKGRREREGGEDKEAREKGKRRGAQEESSCKMPDR